MRNNIINIAYAVSNEYIGLLAVSIASIITNNLDLNINFYILNSDISNDNKRKIDKLKKIKNFNIEYIEMDNNIFNNMANGISIVSNYRLKIASIKKDLDKILFLDSDIIVQSNILKFYNLDLGDNYIAAVADPGITLQYNYTKEDKEKFPDRRFNTGVMLINLKKWREESIEEKLFDAMLWYSKKYANWPDQNVINMVCKDRILEIPYWYNFCPILFQQGWYEEIKESDIDINKIKIVHFAGTPKPWETRDVLKSLKKIGFPYNTKKENLNGKAVFMNDIFWEYAKITPYYEDYLYSYLDNTKNIKNLIKMIVINSNLLKILNLVKFKYRFIKNFVSKKKKNSYKEKIKQIEDLINKLNNLE